MNRRGAAFTTNDEGKRKEYIAAHTSHNSEGSEDGTQVLCLDQFNCFSLEAKKDSNSNANWLLSFFYFFIPISFSCKRTYTDELQTLA